MSERTIYYYKKKDGKEYGTRFEPVPENDPDYENITKEEFERITGVPTDTISKQPTREQHLKMMRIQRLMQNLSATDYQAIKFAEGEMTAEDYAPMKEQRRQWRAEINQLQAELDAELNQ